MNEYSVNIEVKDGDGKIICSQPYNEFMYGTKNIEIQKVLYGRELYDLLVDGLNVIRYNENGKLILGVILQSDINRTAMQLLGRIAEAIIVRNCNHDAGVNRKYFSIARKKQAKMKTADKFWALGAFCGAQRTSMRFRADAVRSITDALKRLLLSVSFWAGSLQCSVSLPVSVSHWLILRH